MSERSYEFLDQGFDVAFHTRHVRDCNLMLRKIADLKFTLCAAPGYLHRAGQPVPATELSDHDCLVNTNDPIWHLNQDGHDLHLKMSEPVYSSNSYVTLRKAAIAGRGIAVLPIRLVGDELADGTLVTVLPDCEVPDRPLYALHSPGTQTTARVRLFLDFVSDWFRKQARPSRPADGRQNRPVAAGASRTPLTRRTIAHATGALAALDRRPCGVAPILSEPATKGFVR